MMTDDSNKLELNYKDYQSDRINDWCAGCGDHGILRALEKALAEMGLPRDQVAAFGGIGCSGKTPYYLNTYGVHTLHGRVLSFATGAKLANPSLNVIAMGGDGDALSIGGGHFINTGRRNLDMTYILFNNGVYGLTKGQAAPTLRPGDQTKSMPRRNIQGQLNPVLLALVSGYTWVGRGYAYDVKALTDLMIEAIRHPGIAFLDVLQPCPKYNDLHSKSWYGERLYDLSEVGHHSLITAESEEQQADEIRNMALIRAREWGDRIPTGIFLRDVSVPQFQEQIAQHQPAYLEQPPSRQITSDKSGRSMVDLSALFENLKIF
jgi:2-oxoglutarate ferredoxin oxidoreductase subunit beta